MSTCNLEIHLYPSLKKKEAGQQIEGSDPTSLLCFCEIPPGVLHPDLVPLEQEKQGLVEVVPEEGHENHYRDGIT